MFILRAFDRNGNELFYTGRAGSNWLSPSIHDSFIYDTLEGASFAAKRRDGLGMSFAVLNFDSYDGGE